MNEIVCSIRDDPTQCLEYMSVQEIVTELMLMMINKILPESSSALPERSSSMNLVT